MIQIHVPGQPKRLTITQTMVEDLLWDPVMAAKVLMGIDLDVFQAIRLRYYWFVPSVIDSSGFSTFKTNIWWIYCQLRAVLLPEHKVGTVYQSFGTGKKAFWDKYRGRWAAHPIFQAQIGNIDESGNEGKANRKDASCYTCYFRNGSTVEMPAGNWLQQARGLASLRWNTGGIDEWTKVEATGTAGIDEQFLGRITNTSWNKEHPIWSNHTKFLATAESRGHPAWRRYANTLKRQKAGNPSVAVISFNYKHYSEKPVPGQEPSRDGHVKTFSGMFRDQKQINEMRANFSRDHFRREALGIWSRSGAEWYKGDLLDRAETLGEFLGHCVELYGFENFEQAG